MVAASDGSKRGRRPCGGREGGDEKGAAVRRMGESGKEWVCRKKERRVTDGREGVKEEKGMVYLERDGREVWVEEKD